MLEILGNSTIVPGGEKLIDTDGLHGASVTDVVNS